MRVFCDIYSADGRTRLGAGPLQVISASVTRTLDGVGSVSISVPGTDDRALTLLANKRRLRIFVEHDNVIRELGRGVIETLSTTDSTNGWTLTASGPDDMSELKHTNTLLARQYSAKSILYVTTNLLFLAGWAGEVTAGNLISVRLDGTSVLKALQTICAQQGLHLRLDPDGNPNTVEIGTFGADSGLRCFHVETINEEIQTNDQVLLIENFKQIQDAKDLCNWLLPLGGGEGEARLTLQHSTRLAPYTIRTMTGPDGLPVYYLSDSDSITTYGQIQKVGSYQNIVPLSNTNTDLINAANALYDAASAWLARYKDPLETYSLTVRKPRRIVQPGDKIHVRYKGLIYRDGGVPVTYRDINRDMWVMECTESVDAGGIKLDLTVATIDRYELDAAAVVMSAIDAVDLQNVSFSPSPWKTDATRAPLPTDDINAGYLIGSRWFFGNHVYDCTSNAPGAAVWNEVTASGAPVEATYITQVPNVTLTNEQALSLLGTGLLKNTTGTGILSIGAGADVATALGSDSQNKVYATPAASSGVPSLRALVANDYPTMVGDTGSGGTKGAVGTPAAGDAAAGKFWRADGTWAAPGVSASAITVTGTAGEALSIRDACYLASDDKWYKLDIDATATVKVGKFRGFATAAASSSAPCTIQTDGALTGFSSLTAGADVYASTTAGGITQTKPTVAAAGGQRAIVRLGYAIDASNVFVQKSSVQFLKRESLTNGSSLTLEHYADALARERRVQAYISATTGGTLTNYASSNQDQAVPLRGGTGAGATTTPYSGTADGQGIGGVSGGQDWAWGQSFQVTAGTLSQFTFNLRANVGTPTGTMTWQICSDSGSAPGTVLATGTLTPTASATNTVAVPDGLFLAASTTYWLVLKSTAAQSTGNYWSWYSSTSSAYASGNASLSTNGGSSWSAQSTIDMACAITTVATTPFDRLAQSFQIGSSSNCDYATLHLRKFGSPTGTMTLRIETNSGSAPSGTLAHANATITVAESGLTTSFADTTFDFTDFALTSGTTYWLVLSTDRTASATNYVVWGVDASSPGYTSGNWSTYASSAYTADSTRDAVFAVVGPVTTYEAPLLVDQWGSALAVALARFDDGAGANGDINSTLKNAVGSTIDVTCEVILP